MSVYSNKPTCDASDPNMGTNRDPYDNTDPHKPMMSVTDTRQMDESTADGRATRPGVGLRAYDPSDVDVNVNDHDDDHTEGTTGVHPDQKPAGYAIKKLIPGTKAHEIYKEEKAAKREGVL